MTEIIPGLQGDIPANSQKGAPYVGGKYEFYENKHTSIFPFLFFSVHSIFIFPSFDLKDTILCIVTIAHDLNLLDFVSLGKIIWLKYNLDNTRRVFLVMDSINKSNEFSGSFYLLFPLLMLKYSSFK